MSIITSRQEMEDFIDSYFEQHRVCFYFEAVAQDILTQEGWHYVDNSPCTCPDYDEDKGHNLTCGYYYKGIVQ